MDLQPIIDVVTTGKDLIRLLPSGTGELTGQVIGAANDQVWRWRQKRHREHLEKMSRATEKLLEGCDRAASPSVKEAELIFEAAKDEDREELQHLWEAMMARLIAGQLRTIRPEWIEIVKKLQEIDVAILTVVESITYTAGYSTPRPLAIINDAISHKWPQSSFHPDDLTLSMSHLESMKMLQLVSTVYTYGETARSPYRLTLLGKKIVEITSPPTKTSG